MKHNSKTSPVLKLVSLAASAVLLAQTALTPAFAATQGTLGATSTGTVDISVTKTQQVQISHLSDLSLPSWTLATGAVTLTTDACVYSTRPGGAYAITVSGNGAGATPFAITDGTNTIPYSVTWNSGGAGSLANTGASLTSGTKATGLLNASTSSTSCTGGDTARLIVGITAAAMTAAPDGSYTGTLTLLVSPT